MVWNELVYVHKNGIPLLVDAYMYLRPRPYKLLHLKIDELRTLSKLPNLKKEKCRVHLESWYVGVLGHVTLMGFKSFERCQNGNGLTSCLQ